MRERRSCPTSVTSGGGPAAAGLPKGRDGSEFGPAKGKEPASARREVVEEQSCPHCTFGNNGKGSSLVIPLLDAK